MKIIKVIVASLIVLTIMSFTCDKFYTKTADMSTSDYSELIIGNWYSNMMCKDGEWLFEESDNDYVLWVFRKNGAFEFHDVDSGEDDVDKGTWSIDEDVLIIVYDDGEKQGFDIVKLNRERLVVKTKVRNHIISVVFKRA